MKPVFPGTASDSVRGVKLEGCALEVGVLLATVQTRARADRVLDQTRPESAAYPGGVTAGTPWSEVIRMV